MYVRVEGSLMMSKNATEQVLHAAPGMPCQMHIMTGCEALRYRLNTSSHSLLPALHQHPAASTIRRH